jgi:putative transposase
MAQRRFTSEEIIGQLRRAEIELSKGKTVGQVCKLLGVTE